jgi:hypothetical protein
MTGPEIEEFLCRAAAFFCVDCLAAALDFPPSQVSMAAQRLRLDKAFATGLGACSRCGRTRSVIGATHPPAPSPWAYRPSV